MGRKDVLQAMQKTAHGSHGSWNCPFSQTDYHHQQSQQCRNTEDNDGGTLYVEANEGGGLLFRNNFEMADKPEPLSHDVNHHIQEGFRHGDASVSCGRNRENFRPVTAVAELQNMKKRRYEENCLDSTSTESLSGVITSTATDGSGGGNSSLWDAPLIQTCYISKASEDNASSTQRCSGSSGNSHGRILSPSSHCKGRARNSTGSNNYQTSNDQEELGEYLGIKEANKGFILLEKLGWVKGTGLGKQEQGTVNPVSCSRKRGRECLGVGTVHQCNLSVRVRNGDGHNNTQGGTYSNTTWVTATDAIDNPTCKEEGTEENGVVSLEEIKLKLQARLERLRSSLGDMTKCLGLSDIPICLSWSNRQVCTEGSLCLYHHFHDDASLAVAKRKILEAKVKTSNPLEGCGDWYKPINEEEEKV